MGVKPYISHVDNSTYTYTFRNGSQIIFMAENFADDKELTRFSGLEVNGFGADEMNELQKATFDKMFERAGSWIIPELGEEQPPSLVLGTCNPSHGWVKENVYDKYVKGTLPESWYYVPAKITDNPHIPKSYLESLRKNLPPIKFRQFVEGDWEAKETTNAFATYFTRENHVMPVQFRDMPLFLAMDFNLNPLGCIAAHIWSDKYGYHVHVVDEIEIENASIPLLIETIRTRYGRYLPSIMITGDAMGKARQITDRENISIYEQIRRGLRLKESQFVLPENPTHANSRADVNYLLYNHPDLKVDPDSCPNLIRDFENVECDIYGKIKKRDRKDPNQRADFIDCFRYLTNTFLQTWIRLHQRTALPSMTAETLKHRDIFKQ